MPGVVKSADYSVGVGTITLDEPQRRNAISADLATQLTEAVATFEADPAIGALVITGSGSSFCAGAVLDELARANERSLRHIYGAFLAVRDARLPTVAAVNGPAVGAGLNLALCCDLRICAERARFESRFLDIGLHPGGGASWLLQRQLGMAGATAMLLFGQPVDGPDAQRLGLAWECVPGDELAARAVEVAARAASFPRALAAELKRTLRRVERVSAHTDALEIELDRQLWSLGRGWLTERTDRKNRS